MAMDRKYLSCGCLQMDTKIKSSFMFYRKNLFAWLIDLYGNLLVPKLRDLVLFGVIHGQTDFWTYLDIEEQIFNYFQDPNSY